MKPYIKITSPRFNSFLERFSPLSKTGISNITLFPFIISKRKMSNATEQHEAIHILQQIECSIVSSLILLPFMFFNFKFALLLPFLWLSSPLFVVFYAFFYIWGYMKYRGRWEETPQDFTRFKAKTLGEFAYFQIPFEQEAYSHGRTDKYLSTRTPFSWMKSKYRV